MKNSIKTLFLAVILGLSPMAVAMDQEFICKVPAAPALDPDYIPGEQEPVKQHDLDSKEFAAQVESKRKSAKHNNAPNKPVATEQSFTTPANERDINMLRKLLNESACSKIVCDYLDGCNPVKLLKGHNAPITHLFDDHSLEYGPQPTDYFVSTDNTGRINVWHPEKSEPVFTHNFNRPIAVINIEPLWAYVDMAYVGVVFHDDPKNVYVYCIHHHKNDSWSLTPSTQFAGHPHAAVSEVEFSPTFEKGIPCELKSLSHTDKNYRCWNIKTGECKSWALNNKRLNSKRMTQHYGCPNCVEYRIRGKSVQVYKKVTRRNKQDQEYTQWEHIKTLEGHTAPITDITTYEFDFDGKIGEEANRTRLITSSKDHTIKIWDTKTGNCVQTLIGPKKAITAFRVLTNNDQKENLVAASADGYIYMWELIDGNELYSTARGIESAPKKKKKELQEEADPTKLAELFAEEPKKENQSWCSVM